MSRSDGPRRTARVRTRVGMLLAVMVGLWLFAMEVIAPQAAGLLVLGLLKDSGIATENVVAAVQQERRLTASALGSATPTRQLAQARLHTDHVAASWRILVGRREHRLTASGELTERLGEFSRQLARLDAVRDDVDHREGTPSALLGEYTAVVDAGFSVYTVLSSLDDPEFARHSGALVRLSYCRELMSRQDALVSASLAAGTLTTADIAAVTKLSGAQRLLYERTAAEIAPADRPMLRAALDSAELAALRGLEDRIGATRPGRPPVTAGEWDATVAAAARLMRDVELTATDNLVASATPIVIRIMARLLGLGVLGLIAVIVCVGTARALVRQLVALRDAAGQLATDRIPAVVGKLSAGQAIDVNVEAPPITLPGRQIAEIGQLVEAFGLVQQAAVQAAVDQADLRTQVRNVFLALARRTQKLAHKQVTVLDGAERRETDPKTTAVLFELDHLATLMRRTAENLIVLANASAGRAWKHPVPVFDVVRGATGEVEDYQRVEVKTCDEAAVDGRVVSDVIHLLAELIENGLSCSPPNSTVTVVGRTVHHGYAVEIEDCGVGMSDEQLNAVNRKLAQPPHFDQVNPAHLGHHVVAALAHKHGIRVSLRTSPYQGVCVIVLLPTRLLALDDTIETVAAPVGARLPISPTAHRDADRGEGRHSAPHQPARLTPPPQPHSSDTKPALPVRQPQASLAPQLSTAPHPSHDHPPHGHPAPPPSPERNRDTLAAIQRGITQGRAAPPGDNTRDTSATEGLPR